MSHVDHSGGQEDGRERGRKNPATVRLLPPPTMPRLPSFVGVGVAHSDELGRRQCYPLHSCASPSSGSRFCTPDTRRHVGSPGGGMARRSIAVAVLVRGDVRPLVIHSAHQNSQVNEERLAMCTGVGRFVGRDRLLAKIALDALFPD